MPRSSRLPLHRPLWMFLLGLSLAAASAGVPAQQLLPPLGEFYGSGDPSRPLFLPDGSLIVGGIFARAGSTPRSNLARFDASGVLDPDWDPAPNAIVRFVLAAPNGDFYVAGEFTALGATPAPGLVRFLAGDPPTLDAGWTPEIPPQNGGVDALALRSDGSLYVAYCEADFSACPIVRLAPDGSRINGFSAQTNSFTNTMVLSPDESSLFVVGGASEANGTPLPSRGGLAKLDAASGALDLDWAPFTAGNGNLRIVLNDGPDHVLVAGTVPGGSEGLARVSIGTGTADLSWGPDFGPNSSTRITNLTRFPDGDLLVTGAFTSADGESRPAGLARLDPAGAVRAGWGANAPPGGSSTLSAAISSSGVAVVPRYPHQNLQQATLFALDPADGSDSGTLVEAEFPGRMVVQRMLSQPGSSRILLAGGTLREVDGRESHAVIALQSDLTPDPGWTSTLGTQVSMGGTLSIDASADDVLVGGFGFDDTSQIRGLWRLAGSDGTASNWEPLAGPGLAISFEAPSAVALDPVGGYAYALGINRDENVANLPGRPLPRFSLSDGLLDPTWTPTVTGSTFDALLRVHEGHLYVAGRLSVTASDQSLVPSFARLSLTGNGRADPGFRPLPADAVVRDILIHDGFAYVAGNGLLARVALDTGEIDPDWSPLPPAFGDALRLSVSPEGELYVAGTLKLGCGGSEVTVARVQPGGNLDPNWTVSSEQVPYAFPGVSALLGLAEGRVLLGGSFTHVNGEPRDGLAAVGPSDTLFADGLGDPLCVAD